MFMPLDKVGLASHIRNGNWLFVTFGDVVWWGWPVHSGPLGVHYTHGEDLRPAAPS
jgi:hypothetical protein